jgi:hypothetical protein
MGSARFAESASVLENGPVQIGQPGSLQPWVSKLSGASHVSNALLKAGHSTSMAAYQAVSRLRPL